jgi:hypothetical protein
MRYSPLDESPFWIEVAISKIGGSIQPRKYRGKELLPFAVWPRFTHSDDSRHHTGMGDGECEWRGTQVQGQCAPTKGWDQSEPLFLGSFRFAHLAVTALRASSRRSSGVSCAIRAFPPFRPPKRPRATAFGFFRFSGFFFFLSMLAGYRIREKTIGTSGGNQLRC